MIQSNLIRHKATRMHTNFQQCTISKALDKQGHLSELYDVLRLLHWNCITPKALNSRVNHARRAQPPREKIPTLCHTYPQKPTHIRAYTRQSKVVHDSHRRMAREHAFGSRTRKKAPREPRESRLRCAYKYLSASYHLIGRAEVCRRQTNANLIFVCRRDFGARELSYKVF